MVDNFVIIDLHGIPITINRKNIKNMYLRVNSTTGHVCVSAPLKLSIEIIKAQLETRSAWIKNTHIKRCEQIKTQPAVMLTGTPHMFLGAYYNLVIHENSHSDKIILSDPDMHCFLKTKNADKSKLVLNNWYKQQMQLLLPNLIAKWSEIIGVSINACQIKIMRSRWGSCNVVTKRISLNLHLIKAPRVCLEYVLVHELVHLHEANHSARFYALMTRFMPDWKNHKHTLTIDHQRHLL